MKSEISDRKRKWRRCIALGAVLLLAGAVVNVLVAWACVLWAPRGQSQRVETFAAGTPLKYEAIGEAAWMVRRAAERPGVSLPEEEYCVIVDEDRGVGVVVSSTTFLEGQGYPMTYGPVCRAGWPLKSMMCFRETPYADWQLGMEYEAPAPRYASSWPPNDLALPLQPIWPAFAADSGFFAGAIGALVLVSPAIRRRRRRRRGRCVACNYQVNDLPICPECGKANSSPRKHGSKASESGS